MRRLAAAIALGLASCGITACATVAEPASQLAEIRAGTLGASAQTAIKVANVGQEYEIIRALGLQPVGQALVQEGGKPFDLMTVRDPQTGKERELWFDISAFFGRY